MSYPPNTSLCSYLFGFHVMFDLQNKSYMCMSSNRFMFTKAFTPFMAQGDWTDERLIFVLDCLWLVFESYLVRGALPWVLHIEWLGFPIESLACKNCHVKTASAKLEELQFLNHSVGYFLHSWAKKHRFFWTQKKSCFICIWHGKICLFRISAASFIVRNTVGLQVLQSCISIWILFNSSKWNYPNLSQHVSIQCILIECGESYSRAYYIQRKGVLKNLSCVPLGK